MQSIKIDGLDELEASWSKLLKEIPESRREMHERIAEAIQNEVQIQIDSSGIQDSSGRVKGWQDASVGSGGGYAAVRAVKGRTGANSPGAITNYLESGHRIRSASGTAKRLRRGRAKKLYVSGYHFYEAADLRAEAIAVKEAEQFADEVAQRLEG